MSLQTCGLTVSRKKILCSYIVQDNKADCCPLSIIRLSLKRGLKNGFRRPSSPPQLQIFPSLNELLPQNSSCHDQMLLPSSPPKRTHRLRLSHSPTNSSATQLDITYSLKLAIKRHLNSPLGFFASYFF